MAVTKDAIAHFDWSSFIIQELCEEIQEFKKDSLKSKTIKTKRGRAIDIRTAAIQLATRNAGASAYIVEEARHEGEATYNRPTTSDESTMTMGMDMTREEEEHELREMTLLTLKKTHNMERRHLLMWMVVLSGTGGERTRPGCERTPCLELRRSQRVVIPSSVLKSPWIEPKRKSKGKRTYDEKDTLFEMCTKFSFFYQTQIFPSCSYKRSYCVLVAKYTLFGCDFGLLHQKQRLFRGTNFISAEHGVLNQG
ncbi:hypothetical protein K1719_046459 [Acacia pycnantha]|nr:hypothetical protein K1719_046459 [Acacia pycnantha]